MHNAAVVLKKYWIPGLWALWMPFYLWSGAAPDRYAMDVLQVQPSSYPTRGILECMAVTAIESGVLYALIRPATYHHSWKRPVAALLLFLPALVVAAVLLIHQPAFVLVHFLWLLLVNLILVVLTAFALLGSRFASRGASAGRG